MCSGVTAYVQSSYNNLIQKNDIEQVWRQFHRIFLTLYCNSLSDNAKSKIHNKICDNGSDQAVTTLFSDSEEFRKKWHKLVVFIAF